MWQHETLIRHIPECQNLIVGSVELGFAFWRLEQRCACFRKPPSSVSRGDSAHVQVRKQFGEPILRAHADTFEDVARVGERIKAESLSGRDKTGQHGCSLPATVAAWENPIFPDPMRRHSGKACSPRIESRTSTPPAVPG